MQAALLRTKEQWPYSIKTSFPCKKGHVSKTISSGLGLHQKAAANRNRTSAEEARDTELRGWAAVSPFEVPPGPQYCAQR